MRRRDFIKGIAGSATVWPFATRAQQPTVPSIGFLNSASPDIYSDRVRAFHRGLNELGYVEGRNVAVEYRWAHNRMDQIPALADDLVLRSVAVIAAGGTPTALAAKRATSTIPIVFQTVTDPVQAGLVESLNRPGGNLTGVTTLGQEVGPKQLELLLELVPNAATVALLCYPNFPNINAVSRELQTFAATRRIDLQIVYASSESDLDRLFDTLLEMKVAALVITSTPLFSSLQAKLAALSLRHHLPAIYQYRDFAVAGGLITYGASFTDAYRIGSYVGRILKGEGPADLPVQQAVRLELIRNLKSAKALGIEVPARLLATADEVIE
jgi:putative ABC transport system substrate-binding protein